MNHKIITRDKQTNNSYKNAITYEFVTSSIFCQLFVTYKYIYLTLNCSLP